MSNELACPEGSESRDATRQHDPDAALELKAGLFIEAIKTVTSAALSNDKHAEMNKNREHALYERAHRVVRLATFFDAYVREFSRIQGFDPGFEEPFLETAEKVIEKMKTAYFDARRPVPAAA